MQLEEDTSTTSNKSKEKVTNLHSKIDHLETKNLDSQLHSRDSEGATLKKEIETKDDIVQNLNRGFNQKVHELKFEVVELESYKQKRTKKEKVPSRKKENN